VQVRRAWQARVMRFGLRLHIRWHPPSIVDMFVLVEVF
jgi:hypothetical protein